MHSRSAQFAFTQMLCVCVLHLFLFFVVVVIHSSRIRLLIYVNLSRSFPHSSSNEQNTNIIIFATKVSVYPSGTAYWLLFCVGCTVNWLKFPKQQQQQQKTCLCDWRLHIENVSNKISDGIPA